VRTQCTTLLPFSLSLVAHDWQSCPMRCPIGRPPLALSVLLLLTDVVVTQSTHSSSGDGSATLSTEKPASSRHVSTPAKSTSTVRGGVSPFKPTSHSESPTITHSSHSHTGSATLNFTHSPFEPFPTDSPAQTTPARSRGPSGWIIFLEVIGTLLGIGLLAALGRCFWSYKKTPRYRHPRQEGIQQIRQELMESRLARVFNRHPPPPPYESAPDYDTAIRSSNMSTSMSSDRMAPVIVHQVPMHPFAPPITQPTSGLPSGMGPASVSFALPPSR